MYTSLISNRKEYLNKNSNIKFKAIRFKNYNDTYQSSKALLQTELDKFTKNTNNAKFIGAGHFAKAYILEKLPSFVMKEAHVKNETFEQEQNNINKITQIYNNAQKFVARAFDVTLNKYYLITTKVAGATPHPDKAPLSPKPIISFSTA